MEKEKEGAGREGAGDEEAGMGERDEIRRHLLADDTGDSEVASMFLMIATKQSKNLPSTWAGDPAGHYPLRPEPNGSEPLSHCAGGLSAGRRL